MKVVGNQCPGKTIGIGFYQHSGQSFDKQISVDIIEKYNPSFNPSDDAC